MANTFIPLHQLAKIIRSKNAGPFRLTFDVIFDNDEAYNLVRDCGALNYSTIAAQFKISEKQICSFYTVDAARAIKITIYRPVDQGALGETDSYGCQQHVPLMTFEVPSN